MIFDVKSPVLGFESVLKMKLEKIDDAFVRLSNTENDVPVFTLISPFVLREYEFDVPEALKLLLDLDKSQNIFIANIMVIQTPIQNSTINFLAPVVFNFDNQTMAQVVLDSVKYPQYGLAESISTYYNAEELQDTKINAATKK